MDIKIAKCKVIIIDDHLLIREGFRSLLEDTEKYQVVATFCSGVEYMENRETVEADLIILDIDMPGPSGLKMIKEIRKTDKTVSILINSIHTEDDLEVQAVKLGATGFISKNASEEIVLRAIETVLNGGIYVMGNGSKDLYKHFENKMHSDLIDYQLSEREITVFYGLCKGKLLKEISFEMNISKSTVSTYKTRIFKKFKVESLLDLVKIGLELNILQ